MHLLMRYAGLHVPRCSYDQSVKDKKHRRQQSKHDNHRQQRASRKQQADRAYKVDVRVECNAYRSCEETECRREYGMDRSLDCIGNSGFFFFFFDALRLVTVCKKYRVVYGGTELYRSYADGCYERQRGTRVVRDRHIDVDRKLNYGHEDHGKRT